MPVFTSEADLEVWIERRIDALDRRFLQGRISEEEYAVAIARISDDADVRARLISERRSA